MDTQHFKKKLEEELAQLEGELNTVGTKNPETGDWVPKQPEENISPDENEVADTIEDYEDNTGILKELEIRYNDIKAALDRIEADTYGVCEVDGEKIEEDRLEANPAARTCKTHL